MRRTPPEDWKNKTWVERAEDRPTRFLRVGQESMQRDARTEASLPDGWSLRE